MVFAREPVDCLHRVRDTWPHDGVLRVEVLKNVSSNYSLRDSYEKEFSKSRLMELEDVDPFMFYSSQTEGKLILFVFNSS